jgi:hypothetical protein
MKNKETLEEVAETAWNLYEHVEGNLYSTSFKNGFKLGAKWQAERMYSEEDLRRAFNDGQENMNYDKAHGYIAILTEQQWFEQFLKNK